MKSFTNHFTNADGSVSVNYGQHKSVVVPADLWEQIKSHIDFLSWAELSSMVAHATNGVSIYSSRDSENRNPNADRNWGRRK
jgi:hypothetical protein